MVAKFNVGDVVSVSFVGEVEEVSCEKGPFDSAKVHYTVKQRDDNKVAKAIALVIGEDALSRVPTPDDELESEVKRDDNPAN